MITLPEEDYPQSYVEEQLSSYTYVGQLEKGTSETEYRHWQIYIENRSPIRFETLQKKFPKGHFERRTGTKEACYRYVTKTETSLGVRISRGDMKIQDKKPGRAELLEQYRIQILTGQTTVSKLILEDSNALPHERSLRVLENEYRKKLCKGRIRDVEVHYIYGATGVGKTRMIYDRYKGHYDDLYVVGDYSHPFDQYDNEDCLVFDEFSGQINFEYLLKILDRYPIELRARYMNKYANFTKVFILSNLPIEDCYPSKFHESKQQWDALLRRIGSYQEMTADGALVDLEKPRSSSAKFRTEGSVARGV